MLCFLSVKEAMSQKLETNNNIQEQEHKKKTASPLLLLVRHKTGFDGFGQC